MDNQVNMNMDMMENNIEEIEAIKSTKEKMPPNTSVTFPLSTLDDAIEFICTAPFDERKAMLLYLHNSEYAFSNLFSNNLISGELVEILNRSFFVLGWNVEEVRYHDVLASAVSRHINLSFVEDLVRSKVSVGLCVLPIAGTISVVMYLHDRITLEETIKGLKEVETILKVEIEQEKELKKLEKEKSNQNDLSSEKLQSIWADMLGDRDYDSIEYDEHKYLKDKIGFGLRGPPQKETGYDDKTKAQIEQLYEVIKTESDKITEFRDRIEISAIYNCLEPLPEEKIKRAAKYPDYNPQTDLNPVPIFVLRKCRESNNPCRIFIDDTGRVYQSWKGYLTRNKYPKYEMIVPLNGRYQVKNQKVLLERHLSPACHLGTKLLQFVDRVNTVAGLTSRAIFILPVIRGLFAIPRWIGPVVTGAGLWTIGRSISTLVDKVTHKESTNFTNSEARGAYLNIVAGSLGFVGAGTNLALTRMVRSGASIGPGLTYFVNTVGFANMGASGACLANSGYEVFDQWYNENRAPSALTILQLSTSVLFFGHAVFNFKGAQTIIDETQARVLQDYQYSLRSNRHRKTFNKFLKETMRTQGDSTRGRAEVISAIRNIKNRDEVFASLTRNNKAMNRAGIRFSADGGQIKLGGIAVDMNKFIGLNKKHTEIFLTNLSQQHFTDQHINTNCNVSFRMVINDILLDCGIDTTRVNLKQIIGLTSGLLAFLREDVRSKLLKAIHIVIRYTFPKLPILIVEQINEIFPKNSLYSEFLRTGISFFGILVDELEDNYKRYMKTNDKKYYKKIFDYVNPLYNKRTVQFLESAIMDSYSGDTLVKPILEEFSSFIIAWVTRVIFKNEEKKESENRRLRHSAGFRVKRINCSDCGGYYFNHI